MAAAGARAAAACRLGPAAPRARLLPHGARSRGLPSAQPLRAVRWRRRWGVAGLPVQQRNTRPTPRARSPDAPPAEGRTGHSGAPREKGSPPSRPAGATACASSLPPRLQPGPAAGECGGDAAARPPERISRERDGWRPCAAVWPGRPRGGGRGVPGSTGAGGRGVQAGTAGATLVRCPSSRAAYNLLAPVLLRPSSSPALSVAGSWHRQGPGATRRP